MVGEKGKNFLPIWVQCIWKEQLPTTSTRYIQLYCSFTFLANNNASEKMVRATVSKSVILYLAAQGARVNEKDKYGLTPLHYAAMRGNEDATKELLACEDIDIEVRTRD